MKIENLNITEGLSFDDVLVVPAYSEVIPKHVDTRTRLTASITLNVPIISAAMDTVTEEELAIALALGGGAGVLHMNLPPEEQARQAGRVKRFLNWIIDRPVTVEKTETVKQAMSLMEKHRISGVLVVSQGKLAGILTRRDLRFLDNPEKKVAEVMTSKLITESESVNLESAQAKFNAHRIEKLPVVDGEGKLVGLITVKDIEKHQKFPDAALDKKGRLIVGAAVSPFDYTKRLPLLVENMVDFVVVDTAHGDSKNVVSCVADIKKTYPGVGVIGGNVATREGTRHLVEAGADAVKVGVGPGAICTTRVVAGIGLPQFTAILECADEADKHGIPVIGDGGIKYSGDITKAIAAGASTVMIGNLFAGLKEAPGQEIIFEGRMFKEFRGMGSIGAIEEGSGDRYQAVKGDVIVPEGIEGRVPYKGELKPFLYQLVSGLKKGMGYCGCTNIDEMRRHRSFVKITAAGLKESHPHDVFITQEAPNYSVRYNGLRF